MKNYSYRLPGRNIYVQIDLMYTKMITRLYVSRPLEGELADFGFSTDKFAYLPPGLEANDTNLKIVDIYRWLGL